MKIAIVFYPIFGVSGGTSSYGGTTGNTNSGWTVGSGPNTSGGFGNPTVMTEIYKKCSNY